MAESIFNRYGGFAKVNRIVSDFCRGVLGHPVLAPYFAHVDMPTLIDHQTKFMATVIGGPASFANEHFARVHAPHHIDGEAEIKGFGIHHPWFLDSELPGRR